MVSPEKVPDPLVASLPWRIASGTSFLPARTGMPQPVGWKPTLGAGAALIWPSSRPRGGAGRGGEVTQKVNWPEVSQCGTLSKHRDISERLSGGMMNVRHRANRTLDVSWRKMCCLGGQRRTTHSRRGVCGSEWMASPGVEMTLCFPVSSLPPASWWCHHLEASREMIFPLS